MGSYDEIAAAGKIKHASNTLKCIGVSWKGNHGVVANLSINNSQVAFPTPRLPL
jgi:hypothetical protein